MKPPATVRDKLATSRNFIIYYGAGQTGELENYDCAIIEPSGHSIAQLRKLQTSGTLAIAYLSVMELAPWAEEMRWLDDSDLLHHHGQKALQSRFGNYLIDLRSQRWQRMLIHKGGQLLQRDGYDGLFLDTIGDLEDERWSPSDRLTLIHSAQEIIRQLRTLYPQAVLIQNNGLESLLPYSALYLDALCWENPPLANPSSQVWLRQMAQHLSTICQWSSLRLMLVCDTPIARDHLVRAHTLFAPLSKGVLTYAAPPDYLIIGENHEQRSQ